MCEHDAVKYLNLFRFKSILMVVVVTFAFSSTFAFAKDDVKNDQIVESVQRLIQSKCVSCHGAEKQEGGLRLDSLTAAKQGGESGPAVVPGDLVKSRLIEAVRFSNPDLQMPPKSRLSDREIKALERWVQSGAVWPEPAMVLVGDESQQSRRVGDAFTDVNNPIRKIFGGERLDLWSLKKPVVDESCFNGLEGLIAESVQHLAPEMIDWLIRKRLAEAGIVPSAQADRRTLIRRLSFDLTGLPPTPDEVRSFVEDSSSNAYETLVDRLLDSPRYGERWARHWLDVVRYADTEGFERDEFRPLAWQYRDYVIRSLNQDKPYDQFIREQIAGDELVNGPPKNAEEADTLIATGFLRLGQWDSTAPIFQEEVRHRDQQLADLANTTGSAFLGLTFSCCQCHDHKYDPLSQADHFRLRAFFAGVTPRNDLVIELADELEEIAKHNAAVDDEAAPLKEEQSKLDKDKKEDQPRYEELAKTIGEIETKKRSPRMTMGATDSGAEAPATHVFYQGDFSQPREEVAPGFVSVLDPNPAAIEPPRADTTGRRLALANWIASAGNPWTARALVNRVWQHHFGVGLVATANDFGFSGARPTNPELLNWLAVAFINDGWSIKKLHRAIVCSATYRQISNGAGYGSESQDNGHNQEDDPENTLLWRQNVVRLDAETLRDSLLSISGALKTADSGKPRWPHVPIDLLHAQPGILEAKDGGDGGRMQGWYEDPVEETDVRSVFLVRKRAMPIPFLQAFDLPDTTVSCARRDTTVVAPQALMLFNSPESIRFALILAERVAKEAGIDPDRRVEVLFQQALSRSPDAKEKAICLDLLRRHADQHRMDGAGDRAELLALRDQCRAVLNLNEFMYID